MREAFFLIVSFFTMYNCSAQEIVGDWNGKLSIQGTSLNIIFHIDKKEQNYTATMDSPEQGVRGLPVDQVDFDGQKLTMNLQSLEASYNGKLSGNTIVGNFAQNGMTFPLDLLKTEQKPQKIKKSKSTLSNFNKKMLGDWNGALDIRGTKIRVVFHLTNHDGQYKATMDSPDQGAKGIPFETIKLEGDKMTLTSKIGITYEGTFEEKHNTLKGLFMQSGIKLPLNMQREKIAKEVKKRPQDPSDFPYHIEDLEIKNDAANLELGATLTLPKDKKAKKIVILISGSGAQNRDSEIVQFNHRPFLVWSDYLTRQGIGVLRFDDRGTAKSTGKFAGSTSADFASDVETIVTYLKNRTDLKEMSIGLMGHSEGGLIAPIVASTNKLVDFVVLLAAPGLSGGQLLLQQKEDVSKMRGISDDKIRFGLNTSKDIFKYINKSIHFSDEKYKKGLSKVIKKNYKKYPPSVFKNTSKEDMMSKEIDVYNDKWMRYFIAYNPNENLQKLQCPVLAMNGTLDIQVRAKENLDAIEKALKQGNHSNYKIVALDNLNHLFQKAKTGNIAEYGQIEETINPKVLELVEKWINEL